MKAMNARSAPHPAPEADDTIEYSTGESTLGQILVARSALGVCAILIGADLALDMRGTTFQRRVWNALRAVPAGTTVSYTELARRLGDAKLARAVAGACAANALALAVPCHRVVRSDGSLSGYRWGVDRKRALIDKEAVA